MTGALLYQWSTAAQLVSVLMIALFYATLSRSLRRAEVAWWARAWWWNFAALALTLVYWVVVPPKAMLVVLRVLYVGGKMAYALLLVQGAMALIHPGSRWLRPRTMAGLIALSTVLSAMVLTDINRIGVGAQGAMGLLFLWCGIVLLRHRDTVAAWLGVGVLARGAFSVVESVAYALNTLPPGTLGATRAADLALFLGAHSSIDLAAEWLIALGGVLALARRSQQEIQTTNDELLAAQEELRRLADRDPLTGLVNRRALTSSFRAVYDTGATIAFFDLDGFKRINDTFGHAAGDACLVRFADALRASFRPTDFIVRYAGDEFVVVAGAMSVDMANERVARVREKLVASEGIPLDFSAGVVPLEPGGEAELALRSADQAMYAAKVAHV